MPRFTKETAAAYGRRGGKRTYKRYGRNYLAEIGRTGFRTTCDRYFAGDREAMLDYLTRMGRMATDPMPYNGAYQPPAHVPPGWPARPARQLPLPLLADNEDFPSPADDRIDGYQIAYLRRQRALAAREMLARWKAERGGAEEECSF